MGVGGGVQLLIRGRGWGQQQTWRVKEKAREGEGIEN